MVLDAAGVGVMRIVAPARWESVYYLARKITGEKMPPKMRKQGSSAIIDLDGRLAVGSPVDEFRSLWTEALGTGSKDVVINLSNVTMVDSSGIGTMIRCHSAVSAAGGKVKVVGANQTVRQAFKITRLDKVFEFHDDEASALATAPN